MSGGEGQMLAIARALMLRPKCLMLDESSLGIMPRLRDAIMATLRQLHTAEGLTMSLVEQNVPAALDLADPGEGTSGERRRTDLVRKAYLGM